MEQHFDIHDLEFLALFEKCTLDSTLFTHEAHLRITWIYIKRDGIKLTIQNLPIRLQDYVNSIGNNDKFNKPLTIAAIKAINHFMLRSESDNFEDFIIEFPRLKFHFNTLMAAHYKIDIFNSPKAMHQYIEPDLLAFG